MWMAAFTIPRITAFRPAQSPPPLATPIVYIGPLLSRVSLSHSILHYSRERYSHTPSRRFLLNACDFVRPATARNSKPSKEWSDEIPGSTQTRGPAFLALRTGNDLHGARLSQAVRAKHRDAPILRPAWIAAKLPLRGGRARTLLRGAACHWIVPPCNSPAADLRVGGGHSKNGPAGELHERGLPVCGASYRGDVCAGDDRPGSNLDRPAFV